MSIETGYESMRQQSDPRAENKAIKRTSARNPPPGGMLQLAPY